MGADQTITIADSVERDTRTCPGERRVVVGSTAARTSDDRFEIGAVRVDRADAAPWSGPARQRDFRPVVGDVDPAVETPVGRYFTMRCLSDPSGSIETT